jgi:hypothetical protein
MGRRLLAALCLGVMFGGAATAAADPIVILNGPGAPLTTGRSAAVFGRILGPDGTDAHLVFDRDRDSLHSTVALSGGGGSGFGTGTLTSSFSDPLHWVGTASTNLSWTAPVAFSAVSAFRGDSKSRRL